MHALQKDGDDAYRLEAFDFGRRMAVEREYRAAAASGAPPSNVLFDASGRYLLYPSVVGIKVAIRLELTLPQGLHVTAAHPLAFGSHRCR